MVGKCNTCQFLFGFFSIVFHYGEKIQSFSQFVQKFIHLTSSSSSYLIKTRAMLLKSSVPFLCSITSLIIIGIAITGMMIH
ncbi:hypothetical protein DERF_004060 [Dermatophagoides farinae]|uniref:Uncharacterized protein n=1 Tax=Dermatophagoides farinae TaxID=6954 RepID=A0A922IG73_DERFA|nr:hypothetical protein DERF_004060 [Dermatophagoides farinae]